QQQHQDTRLSATLTLLELSNLLALLAYVQGQGESEETVRVATTIEGLLQVLGRPRILKTVAAIREEESKKIGEWNHIVFEAARNRINRLTESGNLPQALQEAQALLDKSLQAGIQAYPGADYDIAVAFILLGRVLKKGGASEQAIKPISEAQRRFQAIADQGNTSAARMASACFTEQGSCLFDLGRLNEAAEAYEEGIKLGEERDAVRDIAVGKLNLGTVRLYQ
ncbi:MAG: hypothetical protein GY852_05515, partial [bacterium]|nr:hypothetical protein [bacterium]